MAQCAYFWADCRPPEGYPGGYAEQRITDITPTPGTWHDFEIDQGGNNTWTVWLDNTLEGISTSHPTGDHRGMDVGLESTDFLYPRVPHNIMGTSVYPVKNINLGWCDANWNYHDQWPSNTTLTQEGWAHVQWVDGYYYKRSLDWED